MNISDRMKAIIDKLRQLETEAAAELEEKQKEFRYAVEKGRVRFESTMREHHKSLRQSMRRFIRESSLPAVLASPFVYVVIIPLLILDLLLFLFQMVCSPVYAIPKVKRSDYVVLDRHNLAYLNPIEKLNCVYCGYANGLLAYARAIAGRAEVHWCPIKHALAVKGAHPGYYGFSDYGDAEAFRKRRKPKDRKPETDTASDPADKTSQPD